MQREQYDQETPSYDYVEAGVMPSRGEKITSYRLRGKSRKGWWAALLITAILFFGMGLLASFLAFPLRSFPIGFCPFGEPVSAPIMQAELSTTPQQIILQLNVGVSLSSKYYCTPFVGSPTLPVITTTGEQSSVPGQYKR